MRADDTGASFAGRDVSDAPSAASGSLGGAVMRAVDGGARQKGAQARKKGAVARDARKAFRREGEDAWREG
jgi:hypothetical protein